MRFSGLGWVLKNSGGRGPLAAELHGDQLADHQGDGAGVPARRIVGIVGGEHRGAGQPLGELLLGDVLRPVPPHHVACLMAQHSGELVWPAAEAAIEVRRIGTLPTARSTLDSGFIESPPKRATLWSP